jgi:hypothetical protein
MAMADLTARVHRDTDTSTLQFNWMLGHYPRGQYSVDEGLLDETAKDARAALQELVDGWRAGNPAKYSELLHNVAAQGFELYNKLFLGSRSRDRDSAEKVKEYIAVKLNPLNDTITFEVPSAVHLPWGLLYDDPTVAGNGAVDPNRFWCMRYDVSTHYELLEAYGVETAWRANEYPLLFGAHETAWNAAHSMLRTEQQNHLSHLLRPPEQPKFSRADLVTRWRRDCDRAPYGLLCFYGHASDKMLCIGNDTISHNAFTSDFARMESSDQPPTLVFLAGCQTAIGELDPGFLGATSKPGFCGMIGTEVKVPDVFTLGFLSRFLQRFYEGGSTVGETMRALRSENWPLSLVFSMCCARDLRLAAQPSPAPPAPVPQQNLSEHTISSE